MARAVDDVPRLRPERVPPQNLEAEQSVLGAMMLSAEAIADVVEVLHPDDFYRGAHRKLFETMRAIYRLAASKRNLPLRKLLRSRPSSLSSACW